MPLLSLVKTVALMCPSYHLSVVLIFSRQMPRQGKSREMHESCKPGSTGDRRATFCSIGLAHADVIPVTVEVTSDTLLQQHHARWLMQFILRRISRSPFLTRSCATSSTTSIRPRAAKMASVMPEWTPPPAPTEQVKAALPKLSVYNSLTRTKTPFVPLDPEGKQVTWYACGPTVYDDAVCATLYSCNCMDS